MTSGQPDLHLKSSRPANETLPSPHAKTNRQTTETKIAEEEGREHRKGRKTEREKRHRHEEWRAGLGSRRKLLHPIHQDTKDSLGEALAWL